MLYQNEIVKLFEVNINAIIQTVYYTFSINS